MKASVEAEVKARARKGQALLDDRAAHAHSVEAGRTVRG
jgi:hypothetical protein